MSDWDALIAEVKNENPKKEMEAKDALTEKNRDFEFGDALEDSTKKRVDSAMEKAEVDPLKMKPVTKVKKLETSGDNWYNIPKTEWTEEMKRDWQLIRMRSVLGPGGANSVELPEEYPDFVQFGTISENPIEGQKGRLSKKLRAPTIAESLAKDTEFRSFLEKNYQKLEKKRNGRR
ncbi:Acidic 82 kDa protein [Tritrichomonas foetus]|uniref:Acidic 82 kDa protein n=1 Tax=Tritrichomonas foetus TaxID=1144522 RepID=A0A1J4K3T8_9EUKA|nr:Acidic 82 kDa protein [Tritrichomonas foetus]|eukprot:OHT06113.1 Acidic 82 kDa protein [Tritrichomonas foetus]